jgi:hypothetical protein
MVAKMIASASPLQLQGVHSFLLCYDRGLADTTSTFFSLTFI